MIVISLLFFQIFYCFNMQKLKLKIVKLFLFVKKIFVPKLYTKKTQFVYKKIVKQFIMYTKVVTRFYFTLMLVV